MAEWSNAAVLKTVEGHTSGGSNPSSSAQNNSLIQLWVIFFYQKINLEYTENNNTYVKFFFDL